MLWVIVPTMMALLVLHCCRVAQHTDTQHNHHQWGSHIIYLFHICICLFTATATAQSANMNEFRIEWRNKTKRMNEWMHNNHWIKFPILCAVQCALQTIFFIYATRELASKCADTQNAQTKHNLMPFTKRHQHKITNMQNASIYDS